MRPHYLTEYDQRKALWERSLGYCEAMVNVSTDAQGRSVWTRCWKTPVERHHRLTQGRGGALLDPWTIYHVIHLCHDCHRRSDGGDARVNGLLIDGSVYGNGTHGMPIYVGPDEYLTQVFTAQGES